jgi:hypothetical protein
MSDDAEAAFGAVADELRVSILRELWDAEGPLAFSDLRDRLDVRDSGRFNYHLGKLRGRFVEQSDEGYKLRFAGRRLVTALYSGVYTEEASVEPTPTEGSCFECGGDLQARYEDESANVECADCGVTLVGTEIPPAFVDGREDDLATAIDGYLRTLIRQSTDGFCPRCSGSMTGSLEAGEHGPVAAYECQRCGGEFPGLASMLAFDHPAVVAFYYERGRNIREVPVWQLGWLDDVEFDGDDAVVTVELDGDELPIRIDDSLTVTPGERA